MSRLARRLRPLHPVAGVLALGALIGAGCAGTRRAPSENALDRAGWLVGAWRGEADGAPFYETWERTGDSLLVNRTFAWCNGDTTGTILTPLRRGPEGRLTFGRRAPVWTATAVEAGRLVLESPDARFSQRIVHTRSPEGHWIAELYTNGALTRYDLTPTPPVAEMRRRPFVPPAGTFRGAITLGGRAVPMGVRFEGRGALVTGPDGAERAAEAVCVDGPNVRFRVPEGGAGLEVQAVATGDSLAGRVRAGAQRGTVRLARVR